MNNKGKIKLGRTIAVWAVVIAILCTLYTSYVYGAYSSDVMISEYVEGSSYNKAVEIFNGTSSTINLSQYSIAIYFNGSTSASSNIPLTGTLASGACFVVAHSSASSPLLSKAQFTSSSLSFNGNDAVALKKGAVILDVIGRIGQDPGSEWGTGNTSTADNAIVRKPSVTMGDSNGSDAFDPAVQWNGYAIDTYSNLGTHLTDWFGGSTPTPIPTITPSPTASTAPTPTQSPAPSASPESYKQYFGQMHSHTSYSDGQKTPADAFAYAKGKADFMAVTDHSNSFDSSTDWTKSTEWANLKAAAAAHTIDGQFVAIAGYEMTWSNGTGHMNTFNTDWFESRNNPAMNLTNYYQRIAAQPESFSQWNHPGTTFGDFNNFANYSLASDNAITLLEVANGSGPVGKSGYYPSYDYLWKACDKGWHVAPTIGQDNHSADWISANEARTVVLAPSLTKNNIYDAFKNRRVYTTEDRNLSVSFKINGAVMGSILSQPAVLNAQIAVTDPNSAEKISRIEIMSTGGAIMYSNTFSASSVTWNPTLDATQKYYYLKITQADGNLAYTAPIWTGR